MLNLDTHILIRSFSGQLSRREAQLLANHEWSISAIVLWEITKLRQLGRIEVDLDSPGFTRALASIHVWPLDMAVCRSLRALDFRSDPADEIIAATSLAHNVPLLTRDRRIRQSKVVPFAP